MQFLVDNHSIPKVGLVLGGGGSRGLAHIGILQVLHREQIPIDFIVATSMGGIIAAAYAYGMTPDEIVDGVNRMMGRETQSGSLINLSMLTPSSRQKRLKRQLNTVMEGKTFADLQIPLTIMAVDMISGTEVALTDGLLVPALLASSAVPGVYPPVHIDGMQLSDGGVIDSMATHIAAAQKPDVMIAVDVYPNLSTNDPWNDPISDIVGWEWATTLLGGTGNGQDRTPNLASVMWRSVRVMTWHLHQRRLAEHPPDIYIRPDMDHLGSLDFKDLSGPIDAGIAEAEKHLGALRDIVKREASP